MIGKGTAAAIGSEPEVLILPDAAAGAAAAAQRLVDAVAAAVAVRGRADIATTGGSTPSGIYRALLAEPLRSRVAWDRLHVWFGDERYVPRRDPAANAWLLDAAFFPATGPAGPLPAVNVHAVPVDDTQAAGGRPADCARRYAAAVRAAVPRDEQGRPVFDAILVGIGPDGHVLSIFPGSRAFERTALAVAVPAPAHIGPHVPRVSLNPDVLDAARALIAIAFGQAKADVVRRLLGPAGDERQLPALRARRAGATWVLDAAAASRLPARGGAPVA